MVQLYHCMPTTVCHCMSLHYHAQYLYRTHLFSLYLSIYINLYKSLVHQNNLHNLHNLHNPCTAPCTATVASLLVLSSFVSSILQTFGLSTF